MATDCAVAAPSGSRRHDVHQLLGQDDDFPDRKGKGVRKGRSSSYSGEAKRAHGEAEAERLLARGLAALGLAEGQLAERRKGAWEKEVLAWWLCQHTTARRRWVSERLGMGDESRVAQAIGRLKRKGQPELERLKRRLEQVYENHNGEVEVRMCAFRDRSPLFLWKYKD